MDFPGVAETTSQSWPKSAAPFSAIKGRGVVDVGLDDKGHMG
jgi:hypothetical protein